MSSAADRPSRRRRVHGPNPIANDRRAARREHTLGEDAACAFCGERTPETLISVSRTTLEEQHHVSGRTNDSDLTVLLCRNCHALVTEGQLRLGVDLRRDTQRTVLERQEGALISQAAFDRARADAEQRQARQLAALVVRLDRERPDWREWPEARK
jgi:hypothetical protein